MLNKCYLGYKGKVYRTFKYYEGMMTRVDFRKINLWVLYVFSVCFFFKQIPDVYDTQSITDILKMILLKNQFCFVCFSTDPSSFVLLWKGHLFYKISSQNSILHRTYSMQAVSLHHVSNLTVLPLYKSKTFRYCAFCNNHNCLNESVLNTLIFVDWKEMFQVHSFWKAFREG